MFRRELVEVQSNFKYRKSRIDELFSFGLALSFPRNFVFTLPWASQLHPIRAGHSRPEERVRRIDAIDRLCRDLIWCDASTR